MVGTSSGSDRLVREDRQTLERARRNRLVRPVRWGRRLEEGDGNHRREGMASGDEGKVSADDHKASDGEVMGNGEVESGDVVAEKWIVHEGCLQDESAETAT